MRNAPLEASESGTEEAEESAVIPGFSTAFSCAIVRCKPAPITDAMEQTAWRGLIGRIAAASFLVGFANESVRTLYVQMDLVSAGQYAYAAVEAVDSFIATVLVVELAVLLLLRRTERMAQDCYFAICILLALGILLLPAPALYDGVNSFVPQAINSAAYGAFGMFIWILSACICGSLPRSTITGMATIRAAWALGPLAGIVFGRFVLKTWGPSLEGTYPIMLFALLALIVVATFVFSAEDLGRIMDIVPRKAQQRFRFKCELVAKRYGLTDRESEIMMMLAKGRNLPFIQNQLFLSKSTVSTHRQHIYQKTGVHSQQELINLVQEAE